jgi:hypothetical protein
MRATHPDADKWPAFIDMFGDVNSAAAEPSVDFPGPGNGRTAFADVLAHAAFEISNCTRVFAVLQGVLVAQRCAAARYGCDQGRTGGIRKI